MISHPTGSRRVCSSAQRTAKNLRLVSEVLRQEGLCKQTFDAAGPYSCETLQERWKEWTSINDKMKGEYRFRYLNSIKGTKTLFDEPCRKCDYKLKMAAIDKWKEKALRTEQKTAPEVLADIRRRVRKEMGRKWWKGTKGKVYVPDQQGCLEMKREGGGTLSVAPVGSDLDRDPRLSKFGQMWFSEERVDSPACRLGAAKSKGKLRVVTMQSASMKRQLRPVHEQAYDHISKKPWLVRGSVESKHFESLRTALGKGHDYISGDYEESTNNLNLDAVLAVVEVLSESLPSHLGKLFVSSFRDCVVEELKEDRDRMLKLVVEPVVRGSMMGNLGSFVVLCLLNKVCFDRAKALAGYDRNHPSLINGDDILFPGCSGLYHAWLHCTAEVGFVINRKKTMRSKTYGDLNSQTYRYDRSRLVKKLCFGFLASDSWKQPEGSLATPLFDLCAQLKFSTSARLLIAYPVRRLLARALVPLSSIPRRWWNFLIKKGWFRGVVDRNSDIPVTDTFGAERKLPYVLGPPIHSSPWAESRIRELDKKCTADHVEDWLGIPVPAFGSKTKLDRMPKLRSIFRIRRESLGWRRLWLKPVLDYLSGKHPDLFVEGYPLWVDDQPGLQLAYKLVRSPMRRPLNFSPSLPPVDLSYVSSDVSYYTLPYSPELTGRPVRERMWLASEMNG
nr:MAG: putative RNA-dependent RNA polymerase [Sanya botourmia-like virus 4]